MPTRPSAVQNMKRMISGTGKSHPLEIDECVMFLIKKVSLSFRAHVLTGSYMNRWNSVFARYFHVHNVMATGARSEARSTFTVWASRLECAEGHHEAEIDLHDSLDDGEEYEVLSRAWNAS